MKFRKENKIHYRQDFRGRIGIPSGVDFIIENDTGIFKSQDCFVLRADGYGFLGIEGSYGNGALYVSKSSLSRKQLKRYEKVMEARK